MMTTIILADDEPQVLRVIKTVLSRHGILVIEAKDGLTALSLIQAVDGNISALVSDVQMPKLDGLTLCKAVRETFPSVPVVLISGTPSTEACKTADAFLQKPFDFDSLLSLISSLSQTGPKYGSKQQRAS